VKEKLPPKKKRRAVRPAQIARAVDEGRESLDLYLDEISRVPLLNREEEMELARKAFKGSIVAQERLARHNVRFVVSVAKKFQNRGVPLVDLIGEGNLGLMTAARKFDPDRGVKFISYAVWWIRQAVQAAIARHGRPVRVPLNRTADLSRLGRTTTLLKDRLGRMPTTEELARATGLTVEAVRSLSALNTEAVRLDLVELGRRPDRADARHVDPAPEELHPERLREADQRELRGDVGGAVGARALPDHRGDVHDVAGALAPHVREGGQDAVDRAEVVDAHDLLELGRRGLVDGREDPDAGVVDEDVEPPPRGDRAVDQRADGRLVAHVGGHYARLATGRFHVRRHRAEAVGAARREDDAQPRAAALDRGGGADPARGAGDHDDAARQLAPSHACYCTGVRL